MGLQPDSIWDTSCVHHHNKPCQQPHKVGESYTPISQVSGEAEMHSSIINPCHTQPILMLWRNVASLLHLSRQLFAFMMHNSTSCNICFSVMSYHSHPWTIIPINTCHLSIQGKKEKNLSPLLLYSLSIWVFFYDKAALSNNNQNNVADRLLDRWDRPNSLLQVTSDPQLYLDDRLPAV